LRAREAELFGEPDGTVKDIEEQPEWMKTLISWGEWLIKVSEGDDPSDCESMPLCNLSSRIGWPVNAKLLLLLNSLVAVV
jgi:hypothetical protein